MSHQPINSFDLLMSGAPLLCVTAKTVRGLSSFFS